MHMKLVVASTLDVVSLAEIKMHCRIDHVEEDAYLQSLVKAALSHLETRKGMTGLCFGLSTWELYHDSFPDGPMKLPQRPINAVEKVEYLDASGNYTEWVGSNYTADTVGPFGWVTPVSAWPEIKNARNAVKVTFKAGFGSGNEDVPESLRHAVRMLAAHWYEHREPAVVGNIVSDVPFAVAALIQPWRQLTL